MSQELFFAAWAVVLGFVQLGAAAIAKRLQEPPGWNAGPRDEPVTYHGVAARLTRAQSNLMETLPLFLGAVLICHLAGHERALSAWGVQLYFWGRVVYVPLYAAGIPYIRSLVWIVSAIGLVLVMVAALLPA